MSEDPGALCRRSASVVAQILYPYLASTQNTFLVELNTKV